MKLSSLDLQGRLSNKKFSKDALDEYTKILETPDLLGRLYRLFVYQNTRNGLWRELFDRYVDENSHLGPQWCTDKRTNLIRNLFEAETVTWQKFLEGLVILAPAFDTLHLEVSTDLNGGEPTVLRIRNKSLILDKAIVDTIPKGNKLMPYDFHRSPLEPLPLKVVRDTISGIGSSDEFRKIVRTNLAPYTHSSKLSSTVNSIYVSVLKPTMSWKRMMTILFAVGANVLWVRIKGTKHGIIYKSTTEVKK